MHKTRWLGVGFLVLLAFSLTLLFGIVMTSVYYSRLHAKPTLAPTATLVTQIQSMNELVMVKYVVEKVVKLEGDPSILGRDSVVLLLHAVVKAGVDLGAVRAEDIHVNGKRVEIALPPPRITDCYVDDRKTEVWEHSTAFWRPFDKELEQKARRQALDIIRLSVGESGIHKEALERAKQQLRMIFQAAGFKEVEVRIR